MLTLKSPLSTRWHCHAESVKTLSLNYANFYSALCEIAENTEEPAETRVMQDIWHHLWINLKQLLLGAMWDKILQSSQMYLLPAIPAIYQSLEDCVAGLLDCFSDIESLARNMIPNVSKVYASETSRVERPPKRYVMRHKDLLMPQFLVVMALELALIWLLLISWSHR